MSDTFFQEDEKILRGCFVPTAPTLVTDLVRVAIQRTLPYVFLYHIKKLLPTNQFSQPVQHPSCSYSDLQNIFTAQRPFSDCRSCGA